MVKHMNKEEYAQILKENSKNPNVLENAIISFISGGILGMIAHLLVLFYEKVFEIELLTAIGITGMSFILFAVILTGLGIFDKMVTTYKFGLIIPITGFVHSVASSILDYKKDGLITGMGSNMFKLAGSVILYGTVAAFVMAIVKVVIYG